MKKAIILTTSIILTFSLAITALIMGLVSVGFDKDIQKPNVVYISCSETQHLADQMLVLREGKPQELKKINTIYKYFEESFKQKALSALFSEGLGENIISSHSLIPAKISKNYTSESKITIIFEYKTKQKIIVNETKYEYTYLFFEIDATNERQPIKIGTSDIMSEIDVYDISYNYSYNGQANMKNLYNFAYGLIV